MPLEKGVLSERVKERILQWILEGELAPGDRIVETRVARRLGTSQAPVREALRDLATLGFVESEPYRGTKVRTATKKELVDAIVVRAELESLAGYLAAPRITTEQLSKLEELLAEMKTAADNGDRNLHAEKNAEFHATIVMASENDSLIRVWSLLEPVSRTYITASMPGVDLCWLAWRHDAILDALRSGDPERTAKRMRSHAAEAADLLDLPDDAEGQPTDE